MGKVRKMQLASGEPDIVTTYSGEWSQSYIAAALLTGKTLMERNITVHENVNVSIAMKILAVANIIQAAGCDFNHQGTVDLTERVLTPTDLKVNLELCKNDLRLDWESKKMGASRNGQILPPTFHQFLLADVAGRIAEATENNLWNGNSGHSGAPTDFTGIEKLLEDNGGTDVNSDGVAITSATVVAKIRAAIAGLPEAMHYQSGLKVFVPRAIANLYIQSLGDAGYVNQYQVNTKPLNIDGYDMVLAPGLDPETIIVGETENLGFGTDLLSDLNQAKVIDMEETTGDDNVRIVFKFKAGVQYGVRSRIVLWRNNV